MMRDHLLGTNGIRYSSGGYTHAPQLSIFAGSPPSKLDLTLNQWNSYGAFGYVLLTFYLPDFVVATDGSIALWSHSDPQATVTSTGSVSGTATWFMVHGYTFSTAAKFTGTITGIGGGGDMEIADTNIVDGQSYTTTQFRFAMPQDYTY